MLAMGYPKPLLEGISAVSRCFIASTGLFLAISALTAVQAGKPHTAVEPGIYGNVRYYEESGDVSGIEIDIHAGDDHLVETVFCEGICNLVVWSRYEQRGDWIEYEYRESPDYIRTFRIKRDGRNVRAEELYGGYVTRRKLKRLKQRLGLDMAVDREVNHLDDEGVTGGEAAPQ